MRQLDMGFMQDLKPPQRAPMDLVKLCKEPRDAIRLRYQLSGKGMEQVASEYGTSIPNMSRILCGQVGLKNPVKFQWVCGNTALRQWENQFYPESNEDRLSRLEEAINEMRKRA